jgi:hypothetical protein
MGSIISDLLNRFETGSLNGRKGFAVSRCWLAAQPRLLSKKCSASLSLARTNRLALSASALTGQWSLSTVKAQPGLWIILQSGYPVSAGNPLPTLARHGESSLDDPYAGLHVKGPDGINGQTFNPR